MALPSPVTVWPRDLIAGLDHVQHAASTEDSRPVLCGVLFAGTEAGIRLAAADNYRVAEMTVPVVDSDASAFGSAIVRIEDIPGIRWMLKAARKGNPTMTLTRGEPWYEGSPGTVVVTCLDRTLTLRPIVGTFPNYPIVFEQAERGERRHVHVNPRFLVDMAKALKVWESRVTVSVGGPLDTVIITGDPGSSYREAILPIRVADVPDGEWERASRDQAERAAVARGAVA